METQPASPQDPRRVVIVDLLRAIGEDPDREGLKNTPDRVVRSWSKLFGGYDQKPETILSAVFSETNDYDQMVLLKDCEIYSTCEHHLLPFFGRAHVGYIPGKSVVGISKLARLLECFARRLQIQERLTQQVADALETYLKPRGVGVIIEAQHFCMTSRGVEKQKSVMLTSALRGCFVKQDVREEFHRLCGY